LNMPNTPKAEILACPFRAYPRMACISAGELRVIKIFIWEVRGERVKQTVCVSECFFWYRLTRVVPDKGP